MGRTVLHSSVTRKGQTTIPEKVRKALRVKPGDKLQYEVEGDRATIRVHPGMEDLCTSSPQHRGYKTSMAASFRRAT